MSSSDILSVLEYMEKEKGISREDMIATIANSIKGAAQKGLHAGQELRVEIDRRTGSLKAWSILEVVDSVSEPEQEVHVENARKTHPDAQVGDTIERALDPSYLGRIAAQTARQAIMQRIRDFEKERIFDDFKDQVGDIVTGTVVRRDRSDLIIDLGKTEALMPRKERIPRENFNTGDRIRCLLLKIESGVRGPNLILSRSNFRFVQRLIELEVTEIGDGTVVIERMSREPGYRTKICVSTSDPKVDPVGACVGARGSRVKSIVRELGGEKIDIIRYFPEPSRLLEEALRPAVPQNIKINERDRRIYFEVEDELLPVTIGKGGLNAKLTSQLLGWKLDIGRIERREVTIAEQVQQAANQLADSLGLPTELAARLAATGINGAAVLATVSDADLVSLGFSPEEVEQIGAAREQTSAEA
ncbi:MAG: transcription termination factor NusA [Puniceicoccaceae bacterium]